MFPYFGNNMDFGFLPPGVNGDVQVFNAGLDAVPRYHQNWIKPRGVTMVAMLLIGAGGSGGNGFTGVSTSARGGGGGGASASMAFHIFSAYLLPNQLKVIVGPGSISASGDRSYVAVGGFSVAIPVILAASGPANAVFGGTGTNSGNAAGGAAAGAGTKPQQGWAAAHSFSVFTNGVAGSTGGIATGAAGTAQTAVWNSTPLSGGAGGAGVNSVGTGFAGGEITLQAAVDFADGNFTPASTKIVGGSAGSGAAVGGDGISGLQNLRPLLFTGGTGGGSADGQVGGNGGKGGIGCGGGGGGGGTTGGTGGAGGDGIVIIVSW